MSHSRLFVRLAHKVQPKLSELAGEPYEATLLNTGFLLYSAPVVIITLTFLVFVTDVLLIRENWFLFLIALLLSLGFSRNPFQLEYEFAPGSIATTGGSLSTILNWSLLFTFGPTAIWILILDIVIDGFISYRQRGNFLNKWSAICNATMNLGLPIGIMLFIIWLYQLMGGIYPLEINGFTDVLLPVAALLMTLLGDVVMAILISAWVRHLVASDAQQETGIGFFRQLILTLGLTRAASPFSILAAVIYSSISVIWYLFFLLGTLLSTLLAKSLSRSLRRARQRSRELAILEELARLILEAPPEQGKLSEILPNHLAGLFPNSEALLWLAPDEVLYSTVPDTHGHFLATLKEELKGTDRYKQFEVSLAADPVLYQPFIGGLAFPIRNAAGVLLGGIGIALRSDSFEASWYDATGHSLAAEVAAALLRIETHEQALANERMSQELAVAGQIQSSFLPTTLPEIDGWEIAAALVPARTTSGDFYDLIPLDEHRWGVLVADVADKGTGAALYMALSRTLIRTYAMAEADAPAVALARANERILQDTQSDQFVTVFYGVLNTRDGMLSYCNAGHNPAYLVRGTGRTHLEQLARTGIPLGMFPGMQWEESQVRLNHGDLLIMYTDGVTEAQDNEEQLYDDHRLQQLSQQLTDQSAIQIQTAILESVQSFVGQAPQFDDITLLIVKRQANFERKI